MAHLHRDEDDDKLTITRALLQQAIPRESMMDVLEIRCLAVVYKYNNVKSRASESK